VNSARERIGWDYSSQYDSIKFNIQVVAGGEGNGNDVLLVSISKNFNMATSLGASVGNYGFQPINPYITSEKIYDYTWWTLLWNKVTFTDYGENDYYKRVQLDWKQFYNIKYGFVRIAKSDHSIIWDLIPQKTPIIKHQNYTFKPQILNLKSYLKISFILLAGSLLLQNCNEDIPKRNCDKSYTLNERYLDKLLFDYEHTDTLKYKRILNDVVFDTLVFVKKRKYRDTLLFQNIEGRDDEACRGSDLTRERIGWDYSSQYDSTKFNIQVVASGSGGKGGFRRFSCRYFKKL